MRELRTPTGATPEVNSLVTQIRELFTEIEFPLEPRRAPIFEDIASLPNPEQWEGGMIYIRDIGSSTPMLAYSDRSNWRRVDTNGTL